MRQSYRDGGKVRKRTLANLSSLPLEQIELLRAVLRGDRLVPADRALEIVRARPDGHVQAVLRTLRRIAPQLPPRATIHPIEIASTPHHCPRRPRCLQIRVSVAGWPHILRTLVAYWRMITREVTLCVDMF